MIKHRIAVVTWIISGMCISSFSQENHILIKPNEAKDTINRNIYGHFAEHLGRCIYDGIWVGEDSPIPNIRGIRNDVLETLKELEIPVLRWPGGCYADLYHWKDGIGPKEDRPAIVNKFWGDAVEDNSFGTHEFLDLCEMLNTEAYIAVNVGSGTVEEAYDWIEYITSDKGPMAGLRKLNGREKPWKVKYWCIGNENWGCGGNMDAAYYTSLFKRFSTYCWAHTKIASGGLNHDFNWTETVMKNTKDYPQLIQGYSYHHYTICHDWDVKGSAIRFDEQEWFQTLSKNMQMEENLKAHLAVMDQYDPKKRIALIADEWGNWHDPEPGEDLGVLYQQNTVRDALTASIYLNIFNNHCSRVRMANIAQTVNVLQAMVLTKQDKMIKTPTFYVFKMYKVHYDALLLPVDLSCEKYSMNNEGIPVLSVSASQDAKGNINVTVANVDPKNPKSTIIRIDDNESYKVINAEVITSEKMNDYNDFEKKEKVNMQKFQDYEIKGKVLQVNLPSKSIVLLTMKKDS